MQVTYPDSLAAWDAHSNWISMKECKNYYVFHYSYCADSFVSYKFAIALDSTGKIQSPFRFPSTSEYKGIDTSFSYCQLVSLAKKAKADLEAVDEITFNYNQKRKRFYWNIIPQLKNQKLGENIVYTIEIDAADLSKAVLHQYKTFIEE